LLTKIGGMKKEKSNEILHGLYVKLVKLQKEIIVSGLKLLIILGGKDAAGKDSSIKAITMYLCPRETRVVVLGKPSDKEVREWYFQRYSAHLPAAGEWVLFNRSCYNRAGVEKVIWLHLRKDRPVFR
jgi:polyphosphate kinase